MGVHAWRAPPLFLYNECMTHSFVQQALRSYFAQYPNDTQRLQSTQALLANPDIISRSSMAGHVTASILVLNPEKTHVLTIFHRHLNKRLNPGGHIDEEGNPFDAAFREGQEEVGLPAASVVPISTWDAQSCALDIDAHVIGANAKKNEGEHFHHDIVYATVLKTGVELDTVEDDGVDKREWTPLNEWGKLSERNRRMLSILEDPRYGVFNAMQAPSP